MVVEKCLESRGKVRVVIRDLKQNVRPIHPFAAYSIMILPEVTE